MKVVIIGAVAAGMSSAAKLKRNMKDKVEIKVFEKGSEISYGACGIPFYVSNHIKDASELFARTPEDFHAQGIDLKIKHEVIKVDFNAKEVVVRDINNNLEFKESYDKLIIATGANVRKFAPMDIEYDNLYSIRQVEDGTRVKELLSTKQATNIVVVGAGFIGLEMVEACHTYKDVKIHIVEASPHCLNVVDDEISIDLEDELKRNNVGVHISSKLIEIKSSANKITSVVIECNEEKLEIECDLLLNCAGIAPATQIFNEVEKVANGAIIVNERMETNIVDVYAAGDCSIMKSAITNEYTYAPLGTNANKQGRIIADIIAGKKPQELKLLGSSAMKLFDLDVAKVGVIEKEAQRLGLEYASTLITGNDVASYYGKEKIKIKIVYNPTTRLILGAQLIGQGVVVARCNYFALAIRTGLSVDEFGFMDLAYSPPFSGVWDVSLIAANTAK